MTTFFLKHSVIAIVLNAVICILGYWCFDTLVIREYPDVKIPVFTVSASYPNADITLMESSVTNPLEDELSGVSGVENIVSHTAAERSDIKITFKEGASIDKSMLDLRAALDLASNRLPKDMRAPTLQEVEKDEGVPFMAVSMTSKKMTLGEMNHYANIYLKNVFRSINGVASIDIWEQPYTMEITLDPKRMFSFRVNALDVYNALTNTTMSLPVGKFQNQISTNMDISLSSVDDFREVFIKRQKERPIFLKDVADIDLITDTKKFRTHVNGKPGFGLSLSSKSDANPLDVSRDVKKKIEKLHLPKDLKLDVVLDQSDFIKASLSGIKSAIIESIFLVLAIVYFFLRRFRVTLIPLVTIPIALIGSALFLKICGFSLNTITLLGMVLAIGLVVDDAIVVLENIARHKAKGLSSFEASVIGAKEIGFAVIAMTLTLGSVYAPLSMLPGAVGQIFKEFAVAVAGSVLMSGFVALTLSPLMCSWFLKRDLVHVPCGEVIYQRFLSLCSKKILWSIPVILCFSFGIFKIIRHELAPKEDRGLWGVYMPSIPGKDLDHLEPYTYDIEKKLQDLPEVKGTLTFMGNWGSSVCAITKDYKDRQRSCREITSSLENEMMSLPSLEAHSWSIDSGLPGVKGKEGGDLKLTISTVDNYEKLYHYAQKALKTLKKEFPFVRHDLSFDTPFLKIELDKNKMSHLGIKEENIAKTLEVFFSGSRSLEFSKNGIRYPIIIQGAFYPWTLDELYVTNSKDIPISLTTFSKMIYSTTAKELKHHNQMRSLSLTTSLDQKDNLSSMMPKFLKAVEEAFPKDYKKEWGGIAKAYQKSSWDMILLFIMALIFIYAVLAMQFENFIDPLIVMLTIPLACFGGLLFLWVLGQSINIFTHIGFVTLIGLITKHGILMVEFANQLRKQGLSVSDAIYKSSHLRLRPILMTTSAMILGSFPLVMLSGAGCEARRAIGIVLIGGLSFGTFLTLILLPKIYETMKVIYETRLLKLK